MSIDQHLPESSTHPTILYDGHCVLCNGFVQWLLRRDKQGLFYYATLSSDVGKEMLSSSQIDGDTVVLYDNNQYYTYSDVALRVAARLGGIYRLLSMLGRLVPKKLRDYLYRWVAANRYGWFGKYEACPLPSPELRERMIDL